MALESVIFGTNADLIKAVGDLYIRPGEIVVDPTYGKGTWWGKTDLSRFRLLKSDLRATLKEERHDARNLPHEDESAHKCVLDLPYIHKAGTHLTEEQYNHETTNGKDHDGILRLQQDCIVELYRIVKPGGQIWVKCKDEIQYWTHIELYEFATGLGLYLKDTAILVSTSKICSARWKNQFHLRKTHSFLLIFEKTDKPKRSRSRSAHSNLPGSKGFDAISPK